MTAVAAPIVCGIERTAAARAAARVAAVLARRLGARLELVYVAKPQAAPSPGVIPYIQCALAGEADGLEVDVLLQAGPVPDALADAGRDARLVVVGSCAEGLLRQALHRSVAADVINEPATPVIVVRPRDADENTSWPQGHTIVCGVAGVSDAPVVGDAARLALRLGLDLTLAHVLEPIAASTAAIGGAPTAAMFPSSDDRRDSARELLDEVARVVLERTGVTARARLAEGPAGPELARMAAEEDAALLAVGSSGPGPLAAALARAVSAELIGHAPCPVMVSPW